MVGIDLTRLVRARVEYVFDACRSIDLHTRSMASRSERVVGGKTTGHLDLGESVTWQARHFGLTWRMTAQVTHYARPHMFVDEQTAGPFRTWRHAHFFHPGPDAAQTVMRDVIDFSSPAGFLGKAVAVLLLRPYLRRLIPRRNDVIVRAVED